MKCRQHLKNKQAKPMKKVKKRKTKVQSTSQPKNQRILHNKNLNPRKWIKRKIQKKKVTKRWGQVDGEDGGGEEVGAEGEAVVVEEAEVVERSLHNQSSPS